MSLVDEGRYSAACSSKKIENAFSIRTGISHRSGMTAPRFQVKGNHYNRKKLNRLYRQQPEGRRRFKQVTDRNPIGASKIGGTACNRQVNEGCKDFHSAIASSGNLR